MDSLDRDRLFVALTRPQMFLGVTYSFLMINVVVSTEMFLIFKAFWVIGVALALHCVGWIAHLYDPRIFDLWIVKASRCPRIRNWSFWRCNSYSPS